jgi:glycosyltransferase involved in cell wall biosynthesis
MKMKIAFISEHASPLAILGGVDSGGQNVYVAELARHIFMAGYNVDVYTRHDDASLPEVINWLPGVRVIHVKAGPVRFIPKEELFQHMPEFRDNMEAFIKKNNLHYRLIHANFWMSALVASQLKESLHIPFVVTFHALGHIRKIYQKEQDKFPAERLVIEEETVQKADHIIAECPQDRADLIQYYRAFPEKITIIPCGFSRDEFYPVEKSIARKIIYADPEENIILQLGRMVPRKGVDNVIRALAHTVRNGTSLRLVIVGGEADHPDFLSSPEITRLHQIAMQEGVSDNVSFVGRKDREMLKFYYSAADIFITTPWYEPFGITPLEAMACGTPVIGSDVGGIRYSIADGKTGYLVPPNDPQALSDKIQKLLGNSNLLNTMKENAIRRVNLLFTWERVADAVIALYKNVLAKEPAHVHDDAGRKIKAA